MPDNFILELQVDRFEGDLAVVTGNGAIVNLPRSWLPSNAESGSTVVVVVRVDDVATAAAASEAQELLERLREQ